MTNMEKLEICKKPFIKKNDMMKLLGTNTTVFTPYWNDMIKQLEKSVGHEFGPWGVPKNLCLEYFGIDVEDLRLNAIEEIKKVGA